MNRCLETLIATGPKAGQQLFLPMISLTPNDSGLPFDFTRLQFPVKPCMAMTINKAQGQTLKVAGLHLSQPCFSHGQFYVGCSRVSEKNCLHILCENEQTKNVVYKEVLEKCKTVSIIYIILISISFLIEITAFQSPHHHVLSFYSRLLHQCKTFQQQTHNYIFLSFSRKHNKCSSKIFWATKRLYLPVGVAWVALNQTQCTFRLLYNVSDMQCNSFNFAFITISITQSRHALLFKTPTH